LRIPRYAENLSPTYTARLSGRHRDVRRQQSEDEPPPPTPSAATCSSGLCSRITRSVGTAGACAEEEDASVAMTPEEGEEEEPGGGGAEEGGFLKTLVASIAPSGESTEKQEARVREPNDGREHPTLSAAAVVVVVRRCGGYHRGARGGAG
jgi:hypothetical protein